MGVRRLFVFFVFSLLLTSACYAGGFGFNVSYNKFEESDTDPFNLEPDGEWGLGVRSEFGSSLALVLSFDYYFPDDDIADVDFYEFNGNLIYNFGDSIRPYIGAGAGLARVSFNTDFFDDSESEFGFNLLGGVKFGGGPINPFAEVRYVIYSGDETFNNRFVISGGILF
ncbi:MAG TPA: outer membrane beta-barrel protein [Acidobacteriota bacterium]|jgi:opacity protein-like surface antigen|nr:outer membrane beta-barrel protein [Acidobacteriota bacterium]